MMMKIMTNKKSSINGGDIDHRPRDVGGHRNRAWNWKVLRLALLWARKGGVFKRRLAMEVRYVAFPKLLKSLANYYAALRHLYMQHAASSDHDRLRHGGHHHYNHNIHYYFERQLSFDKTPIFPSSLKLRRRPSKSNSMRFVNIPCLNPPLVLDDFDDHVHDHGHSSDVDRMIIDMINNHDDQSDSTEYDIDKRNHDDHHEFENEEEEEEEEESVDIKAEEFIAKFYQQIKLQKQISYMHN